MNNYLEFKNASDDEIQFELEDGKLWVGFDMGPSSDRASGQYQLTEEQAAQLLSLLSQKDVA